MRLKFVRVWFVALALFVAAHYTGFSPVSISIAQTGQSQLYKEIKALPDVIDVQALKFKPPFKEKYLVKLKQWLDPKDTTAGSFVQRVFISHYSYDVPTVLVTEGYTGSYAESADYTEELSSLFNTNQILVEHRYFGSSQPKKSDWKYLTASNAAADHHHVVTLFKNIYKNKWINTGISKGGQTALIHRTLYPNDVDFSVCYVAPLCFSVEDGRHEPFICCKVANETDRKKVHDFQLEVLKRRNKIFPMFKKYCEKENYTFKIPLQEIYDYCVLEFSFSFWQWGWRPTSIPSVNASDAYLYNYLIRVCSPDYFANEGIESSKAFFVQAAHELGYYGYETKPFSKYLKIKTAKGYLEKIFLPSDYRVAFDSTISQQCARFIRDNDPKMIFIYGEYDPWSAAAVNFDNKKNMYKAVCPGGSHGSRILSLPDDMRNKVTDLIKKWME